MSTTANAAAWARCEAMLTAMHAGDLTTVAAVVDETGLGSESAELLLATLVRADLFEQRGHQFIRISVFGGAELR
jgi:DNA-binding IclR family transcriptional regulator